MGRLEQQARCALDAIVRDPLVIDYTRQTHAKIKAGHRLHCRTAFEVLGERASVATHLMVGTYEPSIRSRLHPDAPDFAAKATQISLGLMVLRSVPYLWMTDIVGSALATPVPPHVIGPEPPLPYPSMYWTFENALSTRLRQSMDEDFWIDAMVVQELDDGYGFWQMGETRTPGRDPRPECRFSKLPYGQRYPDDLGDEAHAWGQMLSCLSFLASPFIPKRRQVVDGKLRRSMSRGPSSRLLDEEVTFVDLRSALVEPTSPAGVDPHEWHHRWIVRGHHRAQWYPSLQAHKLIWVAPYVKGPDGAPMKESVYRVAR